MVRDRENRISAEGRLSRQWLVQHLGDNSYLTRRTHRFPANGYELTRPGSTPFRRKRRLD